MKNLKVNQVVKVRLVHPGEPMRSKPNFYYLVNIINIISRISTA